MANYVSADITSDALGDGGKASSNDGFDATVGAVEAGAGTSIEALSSTISTDTADTNLGSEETVGSSRRGVASAGIGVARGACLASKNSIGAKLTLGTSRAGSAGVAKDISIPNEAFSSRTSNSQATSAGIRGRARGASATGADSGGSRKGTSVRGRGGSSASTDVTRGRSGGRNTGCQTVRVISARIASARLAAGVSGSGRGGRQVGVAKLRGSAQNAVAEASAVGAGGPDGATLWARSGGHANTVGALFGCKAGGRTACLHAGSGPADGTNRAGNRADSGAGGQLAVGVRADDGSVGAGDDGQGAGNRLAGDGG